MRQKRNALCFCWACVLLAAVIVAMQWTLLGVPVAMEEGRLADTLIIAPAEIADHVILGPAQTVPVEASVVADFFGEKTGIQIDFGQVSGCGPIGVHDTIIVKDMMTNPAQETLLAFHDLIGSNRTDQIILIADGGQIAWYEPA